MLPKEGVRIISSEYLATERTIIRNFSTPDTDLLHKLLSNEQVMQYIGDGSLWTKEKVSAYIDYCQKQDGLTPGLWGVYFRQELELIGRCGIAPCKIEEERETELCYLLSTKFWNKGYGFEVAMAIRKYATEILNIDNLVAQTHPGNRFSSRIIERCGFVYEKTVGSGSLERNIYRFKI